MAQILLPPQPRAEPQKRERPSEVDVTLDRVMKGLQIAGSVFQIGAGFQKADQLAQDRAFEKQKFIADQEFKEKQFWLQKRKLDLLEAQARKKAEKKELAYTPEDLTKANEKTQALHKNLVEGDLNNLKQLNVTLGMFERGNPVTIESAKRQFARGVSGEKGVMTDKDAAAAAGSPELWSKLKRFFSEKFEGKLQPEDQRNFAKAIRNVMRTKSKTLIDKTDAFALSRLKAIQPQFTDMTADKIRDLIDINAQVRAVVGGDSAFRALAGGNFLPSGAPLNIPSRNAISSPGTTAATAAPVVRQAQPQINNEFDNFLAD